MQQTAPHDHLIGVTIGNYVVQHKLGTGGMGAVYLAEHPLIGKKVALKILHPEFSTNQEVVTRFFHEAKAVNDIQHPNIVDIVDYGVIAGGNRPSLVYFIMEFLDGPTLTQLIRAEAPLAPERALLVGLQIADALAASHTSDIVHRDLKPDNIILIQRGRQGDFVKVLDFGIAKLTGDQSGSNRTRTGIVMGTPAYMSPEQCEGKGNIDHRTDIYALGILLYEMLTGRVPFQGEGYGEVLVQHLTRRPERPSTIRGVIPPYVEAIVMKALEKRPDARFPNMEEFMKALADPGGYVERQGGIQHFMSSVLTPSPTALPPNPSVSVRNPILMTPHGHEAGTHSMPGLPGSMPSMPGTSIVGPELPRGTRPWLALLFAVLTIGVAVAGYFSYQALFPPEEELALIASRTDGPAIGTTGDPDGDDPTPGVVADAGANPGATADATAPSAAVRVKIMSQPGGAKVYVDDEAEPRGLTPVEFEVERAIEEIQVKLVRDGYEEKVKVLNLATDENAVEFDLPLEKVTESDRRNARPNQRRNRDRDPGNRRNRTKPRSDTDLLAPDF